MALSGAAQLKGTKMAVSQARGVQRFRYQNRRFERIPGMGLLLDAFAAVDCNMAQAIAQRGAQLACGSGCFQCCIQPIPATPLEIVALRFFVGSELASAKREALKTVLASFCGEKAALGAACPFLHEKCCAVYPVRPIACRRYVVFGQPCHPGEDAAQTRPDDVLQPGQKSLQAALRLTLPWYREPHSLPERMSPEESLGFFRRVTTVLQAVPWARFFAP